MADQPDLLPPTPQPTWVRPTGRNQCGRNPEAGPGSCYWWWEGCPNPERKRCYRAWGEQPAVLEHWLAKAPADWEAPPVGIPPPTASKLRHDGTVEVRELKEGGVEWRRRRWEEKTDA